MDSKQAIDLLKRCWEHRFNLEDYQCDELVELIQQQEKMIELAIKEVKNRACPFEFPRVKKSYPNFECADCWRKYLQSEVGK